MFVAQKTCNDGIFSTTKRLECTANYFLTKEKLRKMAKGRKTDWWDEENQEEIIWVSKSEIKRDAEDLKKLGDTLINLSNTNLAKIPLTADLEEAILLAQKLQKGARRRQLQYIGKLLRRMDVEPIQEALAKVENRHQLQQDMLHKIEQYRENLIAQGDAGMQTVLTEYPEMDRQQLRTLIRGAQKEQAQQKHGKAYRDLFVFLKGYMLEE